MKNLNNNVFTAGELKTHAVYPYEDAISCTDACTDASPDGLISIWALILISCNGSKSLKIVITMTMLMENKMSVLCNKDTCSMNDEVCVKVSVFLFYV